MASQKYPSMGISDVARFGDWLRKMREQRGIPLRAVAAAAEMDQAHLSKIELGQRLLTPRQTLAIAKYFRVDHVEMDARRIAEKFRMEHGSSAAASQALRILNTGSFGDAKRARQKRRSRQR